MVETIKDLLPIPLRLFLRRWRARRRLDRNSDRSAAEVFGEIYQQQAWAPHLKLKPGTLYSGPGSDEELGRPYAAEILKYIRSHRIKTIVDLGCGDFRVGRLLAAEGVNYIGVDVVEALIAHNRAKYETATVNFLCRDIAKDELPDGDLCLAREVFQHLSNQQISGALAKMKKYPHVIITDHQLDGTRPINIDRPHGGNSRSSLGTNLDLSKAPFHISGVRMIFEFPARTPGMPDALIRGFYYTN